MAPRDRGRRGRESARKASESKSGRDRAERDRKSRERRSQRDRNEKRDYKESKKYKEHMEKVRKEREAEASKPKRGSQAELKDRRERQERWERNRDKERNERQKREEDKSIWDRMSEGVTEFFTGKETTGVGPVGGPRSYGMSKKAFDTSIGRQRHEARSLDQRLGREVDYFQEAPLDYLSDLLDNPMVSGAVMMSGLGIPALGVKVVDAGMDYYQNEATPLEAVANVGVGALNFSPMGAALPGEVRSIARAGLKAGAEGVAAAGSGVIGGKIGKNVGAQLASVFTDNPMAKAGITAATAAAGTFGAAKATEIAMARPSPQRPVAGMEAPRRDRDRGERRRSPLVSSEERAVEASQRLMEQTGPVDLYAQTVQSLPYYGLSPGLMGQQQQQYYGV